MKDFKEYTNEAIIVEDNFVKNMEAINNNIDKAIKNKDKKTLDRLTAELEQILNDLKMAKKPL